MENRVTINLLNREELDPKLYDIVCELRDKFKIKGWLYVKIKDEDRTCPSDFCGGVIPSPSIDFGSRGKRIRDYVKCENELIIKRRDLEKLNPNKQPDELKVIIAHECSHILNKDQLVWGAASFLIFIGFICLVSLFYLIASLNAFPLPITLLVAIVVFIKYILIAGKRYYRFRRETETRCDRDAVTITQNVDAFIRALKIYRDEPTNVKNTLWMRAKRRWYGFFGGTHNPISERIKYAESLMQKKEN
jgi:Zn-dependent protease with chaperone function